MAVVPERADLLGAEPVDVPLARENGVLRHASDAVLGVRHVDAVPVNRHALVDVLVHDGHLDQFTLVYAQLGPGDAAVEGERIGGPAESRRTSAWRATSRKRTSGGPAGPFSVAMLRPPDGGARRAGAGPPP